MGEEIIKTNKELKIKSFRVDEETFDKFKHIAAKEFGNQGQCLDALINLYELENSKSTLIERKLEIESFQDYLNKINQLFVTSLQMSQDAELRVKEEFVKQLGIKDTTIERLQTREKDYILNLSKEREKAKELEDINKFFEKENKELQKDKSNLTQLVARNHELLEKNKEELLNLDKYKGFEKENAELKIKVSNLNSLFSEKENEIKNKNHEVEFIKKDKEILENRLNETIKEKESLKSFIEALKKDHRKELELLEGKYTKMIQNETERLTKAFDERLLLERKNMELTIKSLENEKELLELKYKYENK